MPDLTLYEYSGLKKDEIRSRLLNEYGIIGFRYKTIDGIKDLKLYKKRNRKTNHRNIVLSIKEQIKSLLFVNRLFPKKN